METRDGQEETVREATVTVLVTGGAGLLGSHVAERALEAGEHVRVMARPGEDVAWLARAGAEVVRADMIDRESLAAAVRGTDVVLHCAGRTGAWGPDEEFDAINVRGLKWLIELAMQSGVRRIVHVSSVTVHGIDVRGSADETAGYRIESDPYSRSKIAGERLVNQLVADLGAPVTIVRPGLIYGPRDTNSFGRFAAMVERGKMIVIGSGRNHVPLVYVTDVAAAMLLAAESDRALGRTYLVVNDEPVTQMDYLSAMSQELGVRPPRRRIPYRAALLLGGAAEAYGHARHLRSAPPLTRFGLQVMGGENRFSIRRAREELGFSPAVNLAEGVRRGIAWYRAAQQVGSAQADRQVPAGAHGYVAMRTEEH